MLHKLSVEKHVGLAAPPCSESKSLTVDAFHSPLYEEELGGVSLRLPCSSA